MGVPILPTVISSPIKNIARGIGKIAGPVVTGFFGMKGQSDTNAMNAREAEKNRQFQALEAQKARDFTDQQSSTSIQRRVADLQAAGLNPALAYQGGADTGGAPMASGAMSHSFQSAEGAGINSALSALQFAQDVQDRQAQRRNVNMDTAQRAITASHLDERLKLEMGEIASRTAKTSGEFERIMKFMDDELQEVRARTRGHSARALLDQLQSSEGRAKSGMYESMFGKALPYLNSAASLFGEAASFRLRGARGASRTVNHYHRRVDQ